MADRVWGKDHAKTTKLPGPDHMGSSACSTLPPQAVSWRSADAGIFPPSNSGSCFFTAHSSSSSTCLSFLWRMEGGWSNLSNFPSFLQAQQYINK